MKSAAVKNAPTHTSFHAMIPSGRNLNIIAKSSVMIPSDSTRSSAPCTRGPSPPSALPSSAPNCEMKALSASDTIRMNASPRMKPSDSRRLKMKLLAPPALGSGSTSHARFSAVCSWMNAPVAPNSTPRMEAMDEKPAPAFVFSSALPIISATCFAVSGPIIPANCSLIFWCTVSASRKMLATMMMSSISGGSAKTM